MTLRQIRVLCTDERTLKNMHTEYPGRAGKKFMEMKTEAAVRNLLKGRRWDTRE